MEAPGDDDGGSERRRKLVMEAPGDDDDGGGKLDIDDKIYGLIGVDKISQSFVKTPEFRRLKNIKQLGLAYFVHTGATHSAYQHSVGVYHLAGDTIHRLKQNQGLELGIEDFDIQAVKLAGLLHDVGRGPLGQSFEKFFLPEGSNEEMSLKIIDYIVDHHHIDIDDDVLKKAKDLLSETLPTEKKYLYDIVANRRNCLDVCTVDSVIRDSRACGLLSNFNFARGLDIRVLDDEICYLDKEYTKIHDLFLSRADMQRTIHTHADVKAIELMVADAILKANDKMKLTLDIENPAAYLQLDDTLLESIESSTEPSLKECRILIRRIRKKDLYQLCSEFVVPNDRLDQFKDVTPKDIISCCQRKSGISLSEDDIRVSNIDVDLARGMSDPFRSINFYRDQSSKFNINLIAGNYASYQSKIVRVYSTMDQPEQAKIAAVCEAFSAFIKRSYGVPQRLLPRPIDPTESMTLPFGELFPRLKRLCRLILSLNEAPVGSDIALHLRQLPPLNEFSPSPEARVISKSPFQKCETLEDLKCVKLLIDRRCYNLINKEAASEKNNPNLRDIRSYARRNGIKLRLIDIKDWIKRDQDIMQHVEEDEAAGRVCRYSEAHSPLPRVTDD